MPGVQWTGLEVVAPRRIWCDHPERPRWDEPEHAVVVDGTEEDDGSELQGVGGAHDGVHQCLADAAALVFGEHAEWAEPQGNGVADRGQRAGNVAGEDARRQLGDQRDAGTQAASVRS